MKKITFLIVAAGLFATEALAQIQPTPMVLPYCQDFETDVGSTFRGQRVPLTQDNGFGFGPAEKEDGSLQGSWGHRFGGYSDVWPAGGFQASVDIYFPLTQHGAGVEENRDYSVALNHAYECDGDGSISQRRDYIFNFGTSPSQPGKWVISASNNAGGSRPEVSPKTPPVWFDGGQWYQMVHVFSESLLPGPNGTVVVCDMFLLERNTGAIVGQWQLSNDKDLVNTGTCDDPPLGSSVPSDLGGNRYGLFVGASQNRPGPWVFEVDNMCLSPNGLPDADDDGIADDDDNCPNTPNANQNDIDGDLIGDACDDDIDGDGILNDVDNCPFDYNPSQSDFDGDFIGDVCDQDLDGDGVLDVVDACLPSPVGAVVNASGCSVSGLCPCDNDWKNHGAYVRCVAHAANDFVNDGLISETDRGEIVSEAGQSDCGSKN